MHIEGNANSINSNHNNMQYFGSYSVFLLFLLLRDSFFFFRLISGSMHKTLSCSLARGMTEMDYMTHTSIHPFVFSSSIPFIEAPLLENAKVYFHLTAEVYYSRQPQTCYIKTEGRKKGGGKCTEDDLGPFFTQTHLPLTPALARSLSRKAATTPVQFI